MFYISSLLAMEFLLEHLDFSLHVWQGNYTEDKNCICAQQNIKIHKQTISQNNINNKYKYLL